MNEFIECPVSFNLFFAWCTSFICFDTNGEEETKKKHAETISIK